MIGLAGPVSRYALRPDPIQQVGLRALKLSASGEASWAPVFRDPFIRRSEPWLWRRRRLCGFPLRVNPDIAQHLQCVIF